MAPGYLVAAERLPHSSESLAEIAVAVGRVRRSAQPGRRRRGVRQTSSIRRPSCSRLALTPGSCWRCAGAPVSPRTDRPLSIGPPSVSARVRKTAWMKRRMASSSWGSAGASRLGRSGLVVPTFQPAQRIIDIGRCGIGFGADRRLEDCAHTVGKCLALRLCIAPAIV
ncbi:hypothetical protein [Piscinibacter sakaiensis]|uniref:hypothetical protein n=1 Tax=Piscinibacter sakaiensis TaxID=1547922 RepID=UPI003AAFE375